ncbi:MAG: 3-isopropylmalate dehydratase small subunit [Candidatus Neomarinimicrobiota bacterium]
MKKFSKHSGIVAPLKMSNVDTDAIIPKQFLKSVERVGFGQFLFDAWRYLDQGEPGMDCSNRPINSDFVLNKKIYNNASILLTMDNFGCGSSREHAPWALLEFGFQVILAPSFADIFYNNCFKNGLLPIILDDKIIDQLFERVNNKEGYTLTIDLHMQSIITPSNREINFNIDASRKMALIEGLDEIGLTMKYSKKIEDFEKKRRIDAPWLFGTQTNN